MSWVWRVAQEWSGDTACLEALKRAGDPDSLAFPTDKGWAYMQNFDRYVRSHPNRRG